MKKLIAIAAALALAGTAAAQPVGHLHGTSKGTHVEVSLGLHKGNGSSIVAIHGHSAHGYGKSAKRWVPGHWETRVEHYTVPARTRRVWCDPVYSYHKDACGNVVKVLVSPGHYDVVVIAPARVECRHVRVWVAGCWR